MKRYIIIYAVFISAGALPLFAQEILIQWTGVVRDELLRPVPFAHVIVLRDLRGTVSDQNGMFTIITYPNDTLIVSCVGYKLAKIPVPNFTIDDSKHYIKDIVLEEEAIEIRELVIFPWRTFGEFREAFLAIELPEDDLLRTYRNISIMQGHIFNAIHNRHASPNANFRDAVNSRTARMMTYGHIFPTYSITNPIAWAQFLHALQSGEFRQRDEGSNEKRPTLIEEYNRENSE